jgi:MFS family permease
MPDRPSLSGRWLQADEIKYLDLQNLIREGGRSQEKVDKFRWKELIALVTDYKVYLQVWILFTASTCAYGLKFTLPSITKSMGYTSAQAQLLTIPPYVCGALSAYVFAKLSDRFMWRMPFVVGPLMIIVLGFAMIMPLAPEITRHIAPCYVGVILICVGQYPTNPAGSAWISGNLAGPSKKAMGIALNIALGNCGGLVGSYMFLENEKPGYRTGFSIGLSFALIAVVSTMLLEYSYWRINKQRAAMSEDDIRVQYTDEQLALLGDKSPLFKHQL